MRPTGCRMRAATVPTSNRVAPNSSALTDIEAFDCKENNMHPKLLAVIGLGAGAAALGLAGELGRAGRALAAAPVSREKVAFSTSLENVPGSRLTAVVVGYGP